MGLLEVVKSRWKIFLAVVFVFLFFNISIKFNGYAKLSYIPSNWLSTRNKGVNKVIAIDGTTTFDSTEKTKKSSSKTVVGDANVLRKSFAKNKDDLFKAIKTVKDNFEKTKPTATKEKTTKRTTTATITSSFLPDMPGIISMDRDLKLPPPVPLRPDSKEILLDYSQKRDYIAMISHDDKCGVRRNTVRDLGLKDFDYENDIFLLIMIKSACGLKDRRDAIRKTWGDENWAKINLKVNVRRVFLLGDCTSVDLRKAVAEEDKEYGDILQWNFFDSFRNLTLKDCLFLQWFARNCEGVPYIFKGDDDVFVNVKNIVKLLKDLPVSKRDDLFMGSVLDGSPRILDPTWKYYVSYNLYPEKMYPPYVSGGGFVMSNKMAVRLFQASLKERIIPIDDAFLGILLKQINVRPQNHRTFKSWGMKKTNICRLAKIFTFHKVLPQQMLQFWQQYINLDINTCEKDTDDVFLTQQKR